MLKLLAVQAAMVGFRSIELCAPQECVPLLQYTLGMRCIGRAENEGVTSTVLQRGETMIIVSTPNGISRIPVAYERAPFPLDPDRLFRFLEAHQAYGVVSVGIEVTNHEALVSEMAANGAEQVTSLTTFSSGTTVSEWPMYRDDPTTVFRFMEPPGLLPCYTPNRSPTPPYYQEAGLRIDHVVSNVRDREQVLGDFQRWLGLHQFAHFSADQIYSEEARSTIDSTVMANPSRGVLLPVNQSVQGPNHVDRFIGTYGQGIQHVAFRVDNIAGEVASMINQREQTGVGLMFLPKCPSYYGTLAPSDFDGLGDLTEGDSQAVYDHLVDKGVVDAFGIVTPLFDEAWDSITLFVPFELHRSEITDVLVKAKYNVLYRLFGNRVSESTYLTCRELGILIDSKDGEDILFQIFTQPLFGHPSGKTLFFEFLSRDCSAPYSPGCGGFGEGNFRRLYQSMETERLRQEQALATSGL